VGRILAVVPETAPYASKHVLDLTHVLVYNNDPDVPRPRPVQDDDGVHVAAFFGDTNGSRSYTGSDVTLLQRVIVGNASGFSSYQLADPLLLADINRNGYLTGGDAILLQRVVVGMPVPYVPPLPVSIAPPPDGGPDPRLSIPTDLVGAVGQTVTVPVNLAVTEAAGITLSSVDLVISYDPDKFAVGNFRQGSLLAGAGFSELLVNAGTPGIIRTTTFTAGSTPLLPQGTVGSLLLMDFTVRAGAAAGSSPVNVRASFADDHGVMVTTLTNAEAVELVLNPPPTDGDQDPIDGLFTVVSNNAPPQVQLANALAVLPEEMVTAERTKVADIVISDDGLGANALKLSGTDAALFEIEGTVLYLKAGMVLDFDSKPVLDVIVDVDDTTVGTTPDDSASLSITVTSDPGVARLFLPTDLHGTAGSTVQVPVNVQVTGGAGITISSVDLAIEYDADRFIISNFRQGSLLTGAGFSAPAVNTGTPGIIRCTMFTVGSTPFLPRGTTGTLLLMDFGVKSSVAGGPSRINLRADYSDGMTSTRTNLTDSEINEVLLEPLPTNADADPGDGLIDIGNMPPKLRLNDTLAAVLENTVINDRLRVADVVVVDDGAGNNLLKINDGPNRAMFQLVSGVLYLNAGVTLDFETNPALDVTLVVDDATVGSTPDDAALFVINLTDVNEPPSGIYLDNNTVQENVSGATIGTLRATDQDKGQTHTFEIADENSPFEIVEGNHLKLKAGQFLQRPLMGGDEPEPVSVMASDSGTPTQSLTEPLSIQVIANSWPWHWQLDPLDVNADGFVVSQDVLIIVNELNLRKVIGSTGKLPQARPFDLRYYYDTNGDGYCAPGDANRIVTFLNTGTRPEGESPAITMNRLVSSAWYLFSASPSAPVATTTSRDAASADSAQSRGATADAVDQYFAAIDDSTGESAAVSPASHSSADVKDWETELEAILGEIIPELASLQP